MEQIPSACTLNEAGEVAFPGYLIQTRFLAFGGDVLLLLARLHITKRENNKKKKYPSVHAPIKTHHILQGVRGNPMHTGCAPGDYCTVGARPGSAGLRVLWTVGNIWWCALHRYGTVQC